MLPKGKIYVKMNMYAKQKGDFLEHYLDNSATTRVDDSVARIACEAMLSCYGNPSSLHSKGVEAELMLRRAKEAVASACAAQSEEIYFTSGATEANNIALIGAALKKRREGDEIITGPYEHPSVSNALKYLSEQGFRIKEIPYENDDDFVKRVYDAVTEKTTLITCMLVNNEVGTLFPIKDMVKAVRRKKNSVTVHCDCVQAFMKMPLNLKNLDVDLASMSGHKIHAPKGVGALYIKKGVKITPTVFGGGQQNGIRPGTEPVPLIAAMGEACSNVSDVAENLSRVSAIKEHLINRLSQSDRIVINSPKNSIGYILNFSVLGIRSEIMLHFLEQKEIYVSSGSACSKGGKSPVLSAMGIGDKRADSAVRVSFSKYSSKEDADALCDALFEGMESLAQDRRR